MFCTNHQIVQTFILIVAVGIVPPIVVVLVILSGFVSFKYLIVTKQQQQKRANLMLNLTMSIH
ncbi:hypothetical protein DERP_002960 [Dermatophagoides pteronyssinus]|uniref:Uncharacterized protein n=1 Tax=Dermatophagoides pteronyssinus TaxID=6956 RepID=A0ABQ8JW78_DERPT|nr:hypothetical protein DERP_002960 [Dermatophagoides pteronyssinus]